MDLEDEAGGCKGKVGKKGTKLIMKSGATVESCQMACLDDKSCKYATLTKKGKRKSKWTCTSFKKCKKMVRKDKYMTFKKSKGSAASDKIWTDSST